MYGIGRILGSHSGGYEDATPCTALKVNWCFGGCHFHLQGRRINKTVNQHESRWQGESCSPETCVDPEGTAWRYVPENWTSYFQNKMFWTKSGTLITEVTLRSWNRTKIFRYPRLLYARHTNCYTSRNNGLI
jgi:hypothetical protein